MAKKVIITAAITGGAHTPSMSPYLPITPEQIADDAVKAYEAGAAIVHIHARNPETGEPSKETELFRDVLTRIKSKCNVIINTTTGGGPGQSIEERLRVVSALKPELASFNSGSINVGLFRMLDLMKIEKWKYPWEEKRLRATEDFVFTNTPKIMKETAQIFTESETKPEAEIFDFGFISNIAFLVEQGYLKKPVYLQFVFGGVGGLTPNAQTLVCLYETAQRSFGNDFSWSVAAPGRFQLPMCTMALTMGGNARVGMEDNLYAGKGNPAKSNADQVEKIVRIAKELDIEIATPDEARELLGLKGVGKVNY